MISRLLRTLMALLAAGALSSSALAAPIAAGAVASSGAASAEPEIQGDFAPPAHAHSARVRASERREITLDAPSASAKAAIATSKAGTPLQVGFARDVADLAATKAMDSKLAWETLEDGGRVAAMSITSPGAAALRMGLLVQSLPAGTMLRFYAPDEAPFDISAREVNESIARNAQAGETGAKARTYWSPVIEGDTIALEIEVPAYASTAEVQLSVPTISHLETNASQGFAMPKTAAASCENDVMCYQSQWGTESNAVARIVFSDTGKSFVCSGTLLADKDPNTAIPYFETANHCVNTQASASSVQSFWFYHSTACNSGTLVRPVTALAPGATLLYNSAITDTSFLKLTSAPPAGTTFAGWNVSAATAAAASVTGIHHPGGDMQKISFGAIRGFSVCTPSGDTSFTCSTAASSSSTFYAINWSSGITEEGSSGSGLFLDNGHYLVGQLYGGNESCDTPGTDWYGRFDVAYNSGNLGQWLGNNQSSAITPAVDYSDLWWNPAESGWGLSLIQHSSNQLYGAWYVYDGTGAPVWVVMPGGTWTSSTAFTGDVYSTTGPDPRGSFNPSLVGRTKIGTATFTFSSSSAGTVSWNVLGVSGSRDIVRQTFGVPDATSATNYQDLWWNAAESGWGLSINQQYRTLFAVWYAYGTNNQPLWYVMPGGAWNGTTYTGSVYRTSAAPAAFFANPHFDASSVGRTLVGSMTLTFSSATSATMSFTIDGVSGSKTITRQSF